MGNVPASLETTRSHLAAETGLPLADIGIAPDESHLRSGGYHDGALDLKAIDAVGNDDYSIRQTRDRSQYNYDVAHGINFASAMDLGNGWPHGGDAAWIRFNVLLRRQLGAKDPKLRAIRGINYTPDGATKRRFDCRTGIESSTTDTVLWHTHIEWWRDTINDTQARDDATTRLVEIAHSAITGVPLDAVAPAPPPKGKSMQFYTVTNVPANTTDIFGVPVANNSRMAITPKGPACYEYGEIIDAFNDAPKQTIVMTWTRFAQLCSAWAPNQLDPAALASALAQPLATAIAPLLPENVDEAAVLSALQSDAGQTALASAATQGVKNL